MFRNFISKYILTKITLDKKPIPQETQKQMLEFFMRTSIPRKKAKKRQSSDKARKGVTNL